LQRKEKKKESAEFLTTIGCPTRTIDFQRRSLPKVPLASSSGITSEKPRRVEVAQLKKKKEDTSKIDR
jgi:hypothetical protein